MDPKHSHGPDRIDYRETSEDLSEIHAAILRENPEPSAAVTPIPLWLITICGFAVAWAGAYLGMFNGGFRGDVFNERLSSPDLLFPQKAKSTGPGAGGPVVEATLAEQGKAVFSNCVPCHQASGVGVPGTYPPLAKSEFVAAGSEKRMIAIILKGVAGPFKVNGTQFNNAMVPWEGPLTDKKIAAVASYVRANFGNSAPEITPNQVAAVRKEFADRKTQWSEADLLQIPLNAPLPPPEGGSGAAPAAAAGGAPAAAGSPAPATAASPAAGAAPAAAAGTTDPVVLISAGKTVYMTICIACHQPTGMGIPPVFPPLTKSEYVNGPADRFAAMILKGNLPPMTVAGTTYASSPMPGQEAVLNDEKIAAVMTYVRSNFGNTPAPVTPDVVAAVRAKLKDRTTSWTEAELKAWPAAAK